MKKKAKILIIDDDPGNVSLLTQALELEQYDVNSAIDGEKGLEKIKDWQPALILLDINMPNMDGVQMLKNLRLAKTDDYIAVIFMSANQRSEDIVRGLDSGADDYLVKPFKMDELMAHIRAKLRVKNLQDELRRTTKRLEELVDYDDLTGLYNMRYMYRRVADELKRAERYTNWMSCIMMDMDNFKHVNDNNDHLFGSWVLTQVARIIREKSRTSDIAARYGGDEYFIVLPQTDSDGAMQMAERLRKTIQSTNFTEGKSHAKLTCSFGIATVLCGKTIIDVKEFIRHADQSLYEAKNSGRNCVRRKTI